MCWLQYFLLNTRFFLLFLKIYGSCWLLVVVHRLCILVHGFFVVVQWALVAVSGLFLAAVSRGCSLAPVGERLTAVASPDAEHRL